MLMPSFQAAFCSPKQLRKCSVADIQNMLHIYALNDIYIIWVPAYAFDYQDCSNIL